MEETGDTAVVLTGPTGSRGSEALPTTNVLQKGGGHHQLIDSSITDNGTNVSFSTPIAGTQISASTGFLGNLEGTASFATSASFATTATSASFASTASFVSGVALLSSGNTFTANNVFSGSVRGEVNALSIASNTASIDCSLDNFFTLLLVSGSNTHLSSSNILPGQTINLRLNQPATGSGTITFNSSYDFAGGIPFTASLTASNVDVMTFIAFDNTTLFGTGLKKFS
jgi:hypothetical protein